eukprot:5517692-Pleurochrysis_carterae.AAC.1
MSLRNICNSASLNRCAAFDAGCVPKTRRRSETQRSVLPLASSCVAADVLVLQEDNAELPPILRRHG